ncbi:MAG: LysM peptidoglycan-binding domain-containing protein [Verrucomicrobiota bacterium]
MNTPSPLVPQGTMPSRGKSTFFFKVLMILTVHVVLIGGMLLQGCKDTNKTDTTGNTPPPDTNAASADTSNLPPVNPAGMSNMAANPQQPGAQQPVVTQPMPPVQPLPPPVVAPVAPPATTGTEYVIASGDTLGAIAHRNGLSLKALLEANPGVSPKKLKVGQKVQIPAGGTAVASAASPGASAPDVAAASGEATVYTVKTGDTLSKIAKANHTSFKKIMALNDLKTTSIKVGQKLKLPVKAAAPEAPTAPTAVAPMPQPAPAPAASTAATTTPTAAN